MMSDQNATTITLNELTFTFEDIAKMDAILAKLPYGVVKPIYDIIYQRTAEQGQAKMKEKEAGKQEPKNHLYQTDNDDIREVVSNV